MGVENPAVLILDEPTSSLDMRSESLIQLGKLKAFDTPQNLERDNAICQEALRLSGLRWLRSGPPSIQAASSLRPPWLPAVWGT